MSRLSNLVYVAIAAALGTGCAPTTIANSEDADATVSPAERAMIRMNRDDDY